MSPRISFLFFFEASFKRAWCADIMWSGINHKKKKKETEKKHISRWACHILLCVMPILLVTYESKSITFYKYIQQTRGQLEQALHCYILIFFWWMLRPVKMLVSHVHNNLKWLAASQRNGRCVLLMWDDRVSLVCAPTCVTFSSKGKSHTSASGPPCIKSSCSPWSRRSLQ